MQTIYHFQETFFTDILSLEVTEREHYNTFSNKNYIPPAYRINELYPGVGILSSVFKNR